MQDVINFNLLKEYDSTLKDVLGVWQKEKTYSVDEVIQYKGNYLKCTTAGTSGTTTLNFTGLDVGDTITDGTVVWEMIEPPSGSGNGLNDWTSNTQYKIDSIVVNDGQIYKSLVEFTSGSTFDNVEILEDYVLQTGDTPIPWAEGTEISINDIVSYDGNYYKAKTNFTCGSTFTKNVFEEYVPKSLTDEEVEEVINSYTPEFNGGSGGENYSTEEKRIGTWIDGKPLYQITIIDTMPIVTTSGTRVTKTIDIVSLNIKMCIFTEGFIHKENVFESIPINSTNNISGGVGRFCEVVRVNSSNSCADSIFIASSLQSDSNTPVYITIHYTKTTD